ncbi:ABC transporter permease [Kutzneria viridogrisea]|uniref:ABC transporter permease n=2 Tax=Kutzneria TaxID=43356 RepID=W5W7L3_9PSEU|nr:ABC transporter permease [Kutzneria albida]AHH96541.1 hypothetical protein KALB_3174 [Kutzneria albida DSM 43870]MBA8928241.1 putative ABC transport system permease protein [Kutzneria viridogrisea]
MTLTDLLRLGLLRVRTKPLRAALSALGISIGIATMIVVVGIPASSQRALMTRLEALGTNLLRAEAGKDPSTQQLVSLPTEAVSMVRRIGPVSTATAVANTHSTINRSNLVTPEQSSGLPVLAADPRLLASVGGRVHSGRFLDQVSQAFPTVVLGSAAASQLGITEAHGDQQVWIGDGWFTVIGVLDQIPLAPDLDRVALVGWQAARERLGFDGHPTVLYLRAEQSRVEQVRGVLAETILPGQSGLVTVGRPSDALAAKQATESAFSALLLGLAAVALLVGGVGVANTMIVSVLERRGEIGLRRALGAHRGQIRVQFLTESVVLCGLGGTVGTILGVAATACYSAGQGWPAVIPPAAVAGGFGAALLVGAVAGVYPAVRAARLPPTAALSAT